MTDELVKRWDDHVESLCSPMSTIEHMAQKMRNRIEQLTAERDRLALAICGGEDAPGYANAQTVETLEYALKQNRQSHWATINSLLAAEAERDRLRGALQQFLIEYDEVDLADAEPSSLTAAVLAARAALKGKTP